MALMYLLVYGSKEIEIVEQKLSVFPSFFICNQPHTEVAHSVSDVVWIARLLLFMQNGCWAVKLLSILSHCKQIN